MRLCWRRSDEQFLNKYANNRHPQVCTSRCLWMGPRAHSLSARRVQSFVMEAEVVGMWRGISKWRGGSCTCKVLLAADARGDQVTRDVDGSQTRLKLIARVSTLCIWNEECLSVSCNHHWKGGLKRPEEAYLLKLLHRVSTKLEDPIIESSKLTQWPP